MKAFITFGAGGQNYKDACSRLTHQASQMNVFDTIIAFSENDLKDDNEFWSKHSDFIVKNKRGYGNWLWKPYLIKKQMDKMKDGDILLYLDAGCELDIKKRDRMIECFSIVEKDLIIGTTLKNHLEKHCSQSQLCCSFKYRQTRQQLSSQPSQLFMQVKHSFSLQNTHRSSPAFFSQ